MAERRPTRASSRLNTNPNPIDGSSRRAKKIQNKDSSGLESAAPSTRIVRGSSVENDPSNEQRVTKKRVKGPAQRLSTVAETTADQYPNLDPQLVKLSDGYVASRTQQGNGDGDQAGGAFQQRREPSSASAATAQTSFSQREFDALDQNAMLDALPDLHQAATNVINLTLSGETATQVRQLTDEESRVYKNLRRLGKVHIAQKEDFSSGQFIDLKRAQRGILGAHEEPAFTDPLVAGLAIVFYLSNLASLVFLTFTDERHRDILEKLNSDFPALFLPEIDFPRQSGYNHDGLRARTLNLALDIRTQFCLTILKQELGENYDPEQIIHECFYDSFDEDDDVLKGWDVSGLKTEDLLPNERELLLERIKIIHGISQDLVSENGLKTSQDLFAWPLLQTNLVEWAKFRSAEIQIEVDRFGGTETIRMGIESARAQLSGRRENNRDGPEDSAGPRVAVDYSPSHLSDSPTNTAELTASMQLQRELHTDPRAVALLLGSLGNAESQENDRHGENIRTAEAALKVSNDWQSEFMEEDGYSEQSRHPLSTLSQSHEIGLAEQNKENIPEMQPAAGPRRRLIDPQPGASRLTFDTQESPQPGPSTERVFRNTGHADLEYIPEPSSQDGGFQTDTRPDFQVAPIPNMRRSGDEAIPSRPAKRPRKSRATPRTRPTPPAARATPQEQQSLDTPGSTQADNYRQAAAQSRLVASQHQKPRKAKEPWTDDEINALIEYIAEYGFLCGKIKEADEETGRRRLTRRDNVALKDKARNMKMDYLRGQIALPMNFEEVPLNRALDQRLRDAGIEPPPLVRRGAELIA